MPEIKTEVPGELVGEAERESHGRLIAVAAVVTTLLAALTGFLQASALSTHDEADARAERLGALSVDAAAGNKDQAQIQIERFQLLAQQQQQEANDDAFHTYGSQAQAGLEATRWQQVAKQTARDTASIAQGQRLLITCPISSVTQCQAPKGLTPICSPTGGSGCGTAPGQGGWYSPQEDPNFPTRYEQNAQRESYFLSAQRDAANEQADAAEGRFVHYAAAVTMFAVAVFLFGYSLTPQGSRRRRLFSGVATGFAVAGGLWALFHLLSTSPNPPSATATRYADGQVAMNDGAYGTAVKDLSRAVALRPKFVDAWASLASARYSAGLPTQYVTNEGDQVASVPALRAAVNDDRQAVANGSAAPTVKFDEGANLLSLGLLTHNDDLISQSREQSAQAEDEFSGQEQAGRHPGIYLLDSEFNVASADLSTGSPAAGEEFRRAMRSMVRFDTQISLETVVAGALTDLNLISQNRPKLASRAASMQAELIREASTSSYWNVSAGGYQPSGHDVAQFSGVQAQPDPGHLQFTISRSSNFRVNDDLLSAQWEYKDPINGNWEVLPDISGVVSPSAGSALSSTGGTSYVSTNPSFLAQTLPHTCLPSGVYRVQLWVNGSLAGQSAPTRSTWTGLGETGFGSLNAAFCRPQGWQSVNVGAGTSLFINGNASSGAALFVLPERAFGGGSVSGFMHDVVTGFAAGGTSPVHGLKTATKVQPSIFMNFNDSQQQLWYYVPGQGKIGGLLSAAGVSPDGELYVGLVYGSASRSQANTLQTQLTDLLLSYSQL